jgi:hypothetical protein
MLDFYTTMHHTVVIGEIPLSTLAGESGESLSVSIRFVYIQERRLVLECEAAKPGSMSKMDHISNSGLAEWGLR